MKDSSLNNGRTINQTPDKEPSESRLSPNSDFDEYHIIRFLGRGGMGEVYIEGNTVKLKDGSVFQGEIILEEGQNNGKMEM